MPVAYVSSRVGGVGWVKMAAWSTALPVNKVSTIGIWVETVLYGVNCVMYALHTFILFHGGKNATLRWGLLVTSTIFFLLATLHVGASVQQLLDAFVYPPNDVPNYSTAYWLECTTTPRVVKSTVYATLLLAHSLILIWRLHVVFIYNWRVTIFPIILTVGFMGSSYAASAGPALPIDAMSDSVTTSLIISAGVIGITLNVSVAGAIVVRLRLISRTITSLTATSTNRFASSTYLVVGSAAISAVSNALVMVLFAWNDPLAWTALDIMCQVTISTELLILVQVQVAQTSRYCTPHGLMINTADGITFRSGILQDSCQDIEFHTTLPRPSCSEHGSHV
ncbi:hypothetical protein HD554DRAFT_1784310 [Boletus coccyginus]|nr:hypothetical protein HD554DRAFT_1784310 [Boletus coccyginus]